MYAIRSYYVLVVDRQPDAAAEVLLEHLAAEPVGKFLSWRRTLQQPIFAAVVEDPRIQAALEDYAHQEDELRAAVIALLHRITSYNVCYTKLLRKKSGSRTVSHLRFGPDPIHSPYLIQSANFIACHTFEQVQKIEIL